MRIQETKVYTFDELSETAKDKARDWYREGIETDQYSEHVLDNASRMADLLGITLQTRTVRLMGGGTRQEPVIDWDLGNGGGVAFGASYSYRKGSARLIAKEAPSSWTNADGTKGESKTNTELNRIARELMDVQRKNFYRLQASVRPTHRETSIAVEVEDSNDSYRDLGKDGDTVTELLEDFASWIDRGLEAEYEYQNSNEAVDETIKANEYEFTEDGHAV